MKLAPARLLLFVVSATIGAASLTPGAHMETADKLPEAHRLQVRHIVANDTDVLLIEIAPSPPTAVNLRIEDPLQPLHATSRNLLEWNSTSPREVPLTNAPRLLLVTARPELPGAPLMMMWVWHGRAHVIVAHTLPELAQEMLQ